MCFLSSANNTNRKSGMLTPSREHGTTSYSFRVWHSVYNQGHDDPSQKTVEHACIDPQVCSTNSGSLDGDRLQPSSIRPGDWTREL